MASFLPKLSLLFNCQKATLVVQKREEGKISLWENLRLQVHLSVCSYCRRFAKQSDMLNGQLKGFSEHMHAQAPYQLSEEKKKSLELMMKDLGK